MKFCPDCQQNKDESEFYLRKRKNGNPNELSHACKDCQKLKWKDWYSKHKKERIAYCSKHALNRKKDIVAFYHELKSKPCQDCGKTYHPWVMEFDHKDENAKFQNVSYLVARRFSKERIFQEAQKCDLVCANCHRERTWNRFKNL